MEILMQNISKKFGEAQVLDSVSFSVEKNEVHALMGENGAGKSTLMKILTGIYTKDSGNIYVDGGEVSYNHPTEAEKDGIIFIHQELNFIPDLTVEENIFLGKEISHNGILDKKQMQKETKEVLDSLGVNINPNDKLSQLSVGKQQMVEIAKALHNDVKTLIMDEPTSALTLAETEILFGVIDKLKQKGVSIIYISHRMEEIFEICDRVTVLRDGKYVGTKLIKETNMDEVVRMMIGREIGDRYPKRNIQKGDLVLEVKNLSKKSIFDNISFDVSKGEILGVSGLMGAGRSEIMHCIFGSMKIDAGTVCVDGKETHIHHPEDAMNLGIAYITEDRKTEGLFLPFAIKDNISIANLKNIANKLHIIDKKKENDICNKDIEDFAIKTTGINQIVEALSGGNQQKVVFAKWVNTNPKILILDEPTRGVDVGAKREIYDIMNQLSKEGVAIIMVSSELPEIIGMSDRVMVIHEGHNAGIVSGKDINEETIMNLATRGEYNG